MRMIVPFNSALGYMLKAMWRFILARKWHWRLRHIKSKGSYHKNLKVVSRSSNQCILWLISALISSDPNWFLVSSVHLETWTSCGRSGLPVSYFNRSSPNLKNCSLITLTVDDKRGANKHRKTRENASSLMFVCPSSKRSVPLTLSKHYCILAFCTNINRLITIWMSIFWWFGGFGIKCNKYTSCLIISGLMLSHW